MKTFAKVFKWEARKMREHLDIGFILALIFLAVVFLLPVPHAGMNRILEAVLVGSYFIVLMPVLMGLYMVLAYPQISIPLAEITRYNLLERGSGLSVVYFVAARLFFSVITVAVGAGLLAASFFAIRPFLVEMEFIGLINFAESLSGNTIAKLFVTSPIVAPAMLFTIFSVLRLRLRIKNIWFKRVYFACFLIACFTVPAFGIERLWNSDSFLVWAAATVAAVLFMLLICTAVDRHAELEVTTI
jgi:hypothetical protein